MDNNFDMDENVDKDMDMDGHGHSHQKSCLCKALMHSVHCLTRRTGLKRLIARIHYL